jgi:hypothetical protein
MSLNTGQTNIFYSRYKLPMRTLKFPEKTTNQTPEISQVFRVEAGRME